MIAKAFPFTATLTFLCVAIGTSLGLVIGVVTAVYQRTWIDNFGIVVAVLFYSIPTFWLGLMLILIFSVGLRMSCRYKASAPGSTSCCRWRRWAWVKAP